MILEVFIFQYYFDDVIDDIDYDEFILDLCFVFDDFGSVICYLMNFLIILDVEFYIDFFV